MRPARQVGSFLLKTGVLCALLHGIWLPLQGTFIRLLALASERTIALMDPGTVIAGLTPRGNSIAIDSVITGVSQTLTQVHCGDLHVSVVIALALVLAAPLKGWRNRVKAVAAALTLILLTMVAVCIVQVEVAAQNTIAARFGLATHTAREQEILDWALRKSSFAAVYLLPAFLYLATAMYARNGAGPPGGVGDAARDSAAAGRPRFIGVNWRRVSAGLAAVLVLGLLLAQARPQVGGHATLRGLRKVVALNPSAAIAHLNLASGLEREGRLEEALASYRMAQRLSPHFVPARLGEGNILFRQGAYDAAAACYESILANDPGHLLARYNLGTLHLKRGMFDVAASHFERILRSTPDDAPALRSLGQALIGLDRPCEALASLERSQSLDPAAAADAALGRQIRGLRSSCPANLPGSTGDRIPPAR